MVAAHASDIATKALKKKEMKEKTPSTKAKPPPMKKAKTS